MRVLVLDGDTRAALAIVRSLGKRGIHVTVASEDEVSLAGCSRWCSERLVYPCPRAFPEAFGDWLVSAMRYGFSSTGPDPRSPECAAYRRAVNAPPCFDTAGNARPTQHWRGGIHGELNSLVLASAPDTVLYTSSDVTASIVGKRRLSLPGAVRASLPPQRSLETALDKAATVALARDLGVCVPKSLVFARKEPADLDSADLEYPVAVKACQSDLPYRSSTSYAEDTESLKLTLAEVLRESQSALVQEVVPGEGIGIFALFDHGKPVVTFAHRRVIEKPPWGGVSAVCESAEPHPDALRSALAMLEELRWHGVAMVEFKLSRDGAPCLMEINPRYWGSLELAIRAGVDFPYLAFQLAAGETPRPGPVRPATNRWVLGEIDSLMTSLLGSGKGRSRARDLFSHVRTFRRGLCCEVERLSDPKPAAYEYASWLRRSASGLERRAGDMRRAGRSRGIVHVHTAFSHDGLLQPVELAEACRARGLSFAAIAEHAEDMDEDATSALVRACEAQSGPDFVLIPGIEHRFRGGVHILVLGQTRVMPGMPLIQSLRLLASEGCALVAAHCEESDDLPASLLQMLTAVEIWNVSRHTRHLPGSGCMAAYRKWAWAYPRLSAIGGLDLHAGTEWGCEVVLQDACEPRIETVLAALNAGRFVTRGRLLSFGSRPDEHAADLALAMGDALVGVRDLRDRVLHHSRYVKD